MEHGSNNTRVIKKKRKLKLYKIWLTNTGTVNLNLAKLLDKKNFLNAESNAG